jgi:hypothetical protein
MFKEVIAGIKNLWRWRKVIYNDRDWDQWYIYEILKTKLQHQSEHFQKHGWTTSAPTHAAEMRECIELIEIVQNEVILDRVLQKDTWTKEDIEAAEEEHNKARKELFDLIEKNIETWWD